MPRKPRTPSRRRLTPKQAVLAVIRRLRAAGFQALLAGGCVRDILLHKTPHDYDVATDATPDSVARLFPRTLTVGAQFGVVIVLVDSHQIEVATFRSDVDYADGRRPQAVVFTDARHDALRRDFTINGMFLDPVAHEVIDYVGGRKDLGNEVIRAIGDPDERFAEDHLRLLRALRFAARFDFRIARSTWQAICKHAPSITRVSAERIAGELEHILTDPHRTRGAQLACDAGLLRLIFPAVDEHALAQGIRLLEHLPRCCSFALALAALLAHVEPDQAERLCRHLKTSNDLRQHVHWLVAHRPLLLASVPISRGPLKKWLAQPLFESLVHLCRAYHLAHSLSLASLRRLRRQIRELGDEPIAPPRLLDGHQLMELGATRGPMLGQLIEELYLAQLENQVQTPAQAQAWVRQWLARHTKP